jgi:hypothetical protein
VGSEDIDGVAEVRDDDKYYGKFFDKIFLSKEIIAEGYDVSWFKQSLENKTVFVEKYGFTGRLPQLPSYYKILGTYDTNTDDDYVEVNTLETTLAGLFKKLNRYSLNSSTGKYEEITVEEELNNVSCYAKQYEIMKELGDDGARIADYSKIIKRLIKAVLPSLSSSDQTLFADLANLAPSDSKLTEMSDREQKLKAILDRYNND